MTAERGELQDAPSVVSEAPPPPHRPGPKPGQLPRVWIYRALALVLAPVVALAALEAGLRLAGYGRRVSFLIADAQPGYLRSNPDFVSWFMPSTFDLRPINFRVAKAKPPGALRVVVLGESAAQGVPVPAFGFAAQLRAQLRSRFPGREVEVINTGIVAINSHVVYQVAREMAGISPDLFVIYMGNNEVVGPYGPGCAYLSQMPPLWVIRLSVYVKSTRTGQLLGSIAGHLARSSGRPAEWGGMSMFADNAVRGDDARLEATYRNFEANLRDIVAVASRSGARTLLCTAACNLKDCAPLLSLHRLGLSAEQRSSADGDFMNARVAWLAGRLAQAREDLGEALRIDPQFADASYLLGQVELAEGHLEAARARLLDAEHWDALRFRPDPRINEVVRSVARDHPGVTLLDAALRMGSDPRSEAEPSGRRLFLEHVHFDWQGNYELALWMAQEAESQLKGAAKGGGPWLDPQSCANAVGYTAHERLNVLQKIASIVQNPPFTNQLTYCADEARLARETSAAEAQSLDTRTLYRARDTVRASQAADPSNPDLPKILEDIDDQLGDLEAALADARRAEGLQPESFTLKTDEAIKLSRLHRFDEAEKLLRATVASCSPRDRLTMMPAFADFFARTQRFGEGMRFLDAEIRGHPTETSLLLIRGRLAKLSGDYPAAERDYRALLQADPSSEPALEALFGVLNIQGKTKDAENASVEAAPHQPRNHVNDLRAAVILDRRGDPDGSTRWLLAAEHSGEVTSAVEHRIAEHLLEKGQRQEALIHLGEARVLALVEGEDSTAQALTQAIDRLLPPKS